MKPIGFHPEARTEAVESARYDEEQQPGLGKRFSIALQDGITHIQNQPQLYPRIEADRQRTLLSHFPYGIIYRERESEIQIIAVMHLRRAPDYWQHRLKSKSEQ